MVAMNNAVGVGLGSRVLRVAQNPQGHPRRYRGGGRAVAEGCRRLRRIRGVRSPADRAQPRGRPIRVSSVVWVRARPRAVRGTGRRRSRSRLPLPEGHRWSQRPTGVPTGSRGGRPPWSRQRTAPATAATYVRNGLSIRAWTRSFRGSRARRRRDVWEIGGRPSQRFDRAVQQVFGEFGPQPAECRDIRGARVNTSAELTEKLHAPPLLPDRREPGTADSIGDVLVWRLRRLADLPADAATMPDPTLCRRAVSPAPSRDGRPPQDAVMQHMRRCRMGVGSGAALRCAGRVCIWCVLKRRCVGQAAVPGTVGPGGAVASTEAPAPRAGDTETTRSPAPPGSGPQNHGVPATPLGPRRVSAGGLFHD